MKKIASIHFVSIHKLILTSLFLFILLVEHTLGQEVQEEETQGQRVMALSTIPRSEHPKPQFYRDEWMNLNGPWKFHMDFGMTGEERAWHKDPSEFDQKIVVPFPPESPMSGIEYKDFMPAVWYHRDFEVPQNWEGDHVFLHFGGVDYICEAWVNGQSVGKHYGGSSSFSFDITKALQAGVNQLVVRAIDEIRDGNQPSGKQSNRDYYNQGCCKYTRVTGIWQTVWLEARPKQHLRHVRIIPNVDQSEFTFIPEIEHPMGNMTFNVSIQAEGEELLSQSFPATNGIPVSVPIKEPQLWSPENPYLYDIMLSLVDEEGNTVDEVQTYAGMRKVHWAGNKIYLNNEPIYLRFVLDQGFFPEGVWTAPSDDALKADIERSMAVGFNGARLHEKVFEERFHYWADKLGYLTWGEYPDWGISRTYEEPEAWLNLTREWREVMMRDVNHPSIIAWTPLNETHSGKQNYEAYRRAAEEIYELTQDLDPSRPINDASGFIHIKTDIYTVHDYTQEADIIEKRYAEIRPDNEDVYELDWDWFGELKEYDIKYAGQPYVVDEYGGTFWTPEYADQPEAGNGRAKWGFGKTAEQVEDLIEALTQPLLNNPNIVGFTYTQLTDVEQEVNGIYTYDRKLKFDVERLKAIFGAPAAVENNNVDMSKGK